jgi:hypothetical protein
VLHYWFVNAKRLFHMVIALAFLVLTVAGASQAFAAWEDYRKTPDQGMIYFSMYAGLTVFLAMLCLYSFAKARSVR